MPIRLDAFLNDFFALCRKNGIIIESKLGAGGFGCVYAGTLKKPYPNDPDMSNEVAVKLVVYDEKTRDRVDYEVRTQMKFNHPNIVRVFEVFVILIILCASPFVCVCVCCAYCCYLFICLFLLTFL